MFNFLILDSVAGVLDSVVATITICVVNYDCFDDKGVSMEKFIKGLPSIAN